jgi:hypothetical protein
VLFAHSESGPIDVAGIVFVMAMVAPAAFWLVRINKRLDATEDPMTDTRPAQPKRPAYITYGLVGCALAVAVVGVLLVVNAQRHSVISEPQNVVDDLCLAADQATTDPKAALATFNGRPHNALHKLETDLRAADPAAALRVTNAKAAAEQAMIDGTPEASALTATLAEETTEAYRTLDPGATINACA